ncbi:hypothetical protein [Vibrio salinus]|uniref:hypothetical protein n=1 Tax=Vibrio salinus TaxID=2899784 RepID=UPI001E2AC405|nr:hypothetical protein [Vibrio salinus]MCE0492493.1 hypothetical protein [Vibrio salinus]
MSREFHLKDCWLFHSSIVDSAGMPKKKAMPILVEEQTKQFDKDVVQVFISLDEKGILDHIIGHSDEGILFEVCPMCGSVLVVQKENKEGNKIYCRNCTGEFSLAMQNGKLYLFLPVDKVNRKICMFLVQC